MARQRETKDGGLLRFDASNIAVHILDREFVRRLATGGDSAALPFHRADKKIPTIDSAGQPVKPGQHNGVKFEMFVFDALPFARQPLLIETRRADDFSPVKNADGADSPQTARDDQVRQATRWLKAAGTTVPTDATGLPDCTVEVSPLFGCDEESFVESWGKLPHQPAINGDLYLE